MRYVLKASREGLPRFFIFLMFIAGFAVAFDPLQVCSQDTSGIYTIYIDGTNKTRLTADKAWGTKWSPDGRCIVFRGEDGIYVMNADGTNKVRLTDYGGNPVWSPDGKCIVYTRVQYPKVYEIHVMNADGTNQVRLVDNGAYPVWSPDGKHIAFTGERMGIFVIDVDGTSAVNLTTDYGTAPAWSPDGKCIAYHRSPHIGESEIIMMNADGSEGVKIVDLYGTSPVWSPDGVKIAFSTSRGINVVNADGTDPIHLIEELDTYISDFTWSPDGKHVIYRRGKQNEIYIMNADGSNKVLLTDCGRDPSWSPDGKRIVFTGVSD